MCFILSPGAEASRFVRQHRPRTDEPQYPANHIFYANILDHFPAPPPASTPNMTEAIKDQDDAPINVTLTGYDKVAYGKHLEDITLEAEAFSAWVKAKGITWEEGKDHQEELERQFKQELELARQNEMSKAQNTGKKNDTGDEDFDRFLDEKRLVWDNISEAQQAALKPLWELNLQRKREQVKLKARDEVLEEQKLEKEEAIAASVASDSVSFGANDMTAAMENILQKAKKFEEEMRSLVREVQSLNKSTTSPEDGAAGAGAKGKGKAIAEETPGERVEKAIRKQVAESAAKAAKEVKSSKSSKKMTKKEWMFLR